MAGVAFFIGKHETQAGWKVQPSGYACTVVGKVKDISDTTSTSFIHFKFLDAKGEVLGNASCNSDRTTGWRAASTRCSASSG